jgi:hypothetical protein
VQFQYSATPSATTLKIKAFVEENTSSKLFNNEQIIEEQKAPANLARSRRVEVERSVDT